MLIRAYEKIQSEGMEEPEGAKAAKNEWLGENERNHVDKFLDDYEITNDENDYVLSSEIEDWGKEKKLGISHTKFLRDLKTYCVKNESTNVQVSIKKLSKKATRVWLGIKRLEEEMDEEFPTL